jgi:hypothetical protein
MRYTAQPTGRIVPTKVIREAALKFLSLKNRVRFCPINLIRTETAGFAKLRTASVSFRKKLCPLERDQNRTDGATWPTFGSNTSGDFTKSAFGV